MKRIIPLLLALMVVSCAAGKQSSRYWNDMGLEHKDAGRYGDAEEAFGRAISINPRNVEAHNNLGRIYFKTKQYEKAIESFKRAIELKPDAIGTYNNLAESYAKLERFDEAIQTFRDALEIKPDDTQTRFGLGIVYLMKGDRESALEEYKVLRRLDKQRAEALFDMILK